MAVSDLTGTKWVFNSTVSSTPFAYSSVSLNFISNNEVFIGILDSADTSLDYETSDDHVSAYTNYDEWTNNAYRIISITGGTDATNADLIAWLEANATQINVTDLTGTTWIINDNPTINPPSIHVQNIYFTSNNKQHNELFIGYIPELDREDEIWYGGDPTETYIQTYTVSNGWTNNAYKTITITGGAGATDATFINWLVQNATQQETPQANTYEVTHSLTNLSYGNITLTVAAEQGYALPSSSSSITVTNGTLVSYDSSTGVIVVSGDDTTTVSMECEEEVSGYSVSTASNFSADGYRYGVEDDQGNYIDGDIGIYGPNQLLFQSTTTLSWGIGTPEHEFVYTMGGQTYTSTARSGLVTLTDNLEIVYVKATCLTGDTLITMADYSTKRLDEVELGDKVLSFDFDTMKLVPKRVVFTDKDENKSFSEYEVWNFDDGTQIKTVHKHEFYNVELGKMEYMDKWNIGDRAYKLDGSTPKLVSHEVVKEAVNHYKITLEGGTNYFANGLLNGDRYCPKNIQLGKD